MRREEIEAVLELEGPARFEYFVKRVADFERAWGLWNGGWALMADEKGAEVFPLWPAPEYAALHRTDSWSAHEVREISLADLTEQLLPALEKKGMSPGVFPTPSGRGVTTTVDELLRALQRELEEHY